MRPWVKYEQLPMQNLKRQLTATAGFWSIFGLLGAAHAKQLVPCLNKSLGNEKYSLRKLIPIQIQ